MDLVWRMNCGSLKEEIGARLVSFLAATKMRHSLCVTTKEEEKKGAHFLRALPFRAISFTGLLTGFILSLATVLATSLGRFLVAKEVLYSARASGAMTRDNCASLAAL